MTKTSKLIYTNTMVEMCLFSFELALFFAPWGCTINNYMQDLLKVKEVEAEPVLLPLIVGLCMDNSSNITFAPNNL